MRASLTRIICERILGYVIEDVYNGYRSTYNGNRRTYNGNRTMLRDVSYNYYLTLFTIIFYKLINYYSFSKNFYNFLFSKKL